MCLYSRKNVAEQAEADSSKDESFQVVKIVIQNFCRMDLDFFKSEF